MKKQWASASLEVLDIKETAGGIYTPYVEDSDFVTCTHDFDGDGKPDHGADKGYGSKYQSGSNEVK